MTNCTATRCAAQKNLVVGEAPCSDRNLRAYGSSFRYIFHSCITSFLWTYRMHQSHVLSSSWRWTSIFGVVCFSGNGCLISLSLSHEHPKSYQALAQHGPLAENDHLKTQFFPQNYANFMVL